MIYSSPELEPPTGYQHGDLDLNKFNQDIQLVQETLTDGGTISFY